MKKTTALTVVLALLAATPALARTRHHQSSPPASSYVGSTYGAPAYTVPAYPNEVPFAPF